MILKLLRGFGGDVRFGRPEFTSTNWLTSTAGDIKERIARLAEQEAELISLENGAERATLPSTIKVLLLLYIDIHISFVFHPDVRK